MKRVAAAATCLALGIFLVGAQRPGAAPAAQKNLKPKVKVVERVVAGGYAENITYVTGGKFAGLIAMAVGGQALGVPPDGGKLQTLFDFRVAGPQFRPTGFVYAGDWDRFVANDSNAMTSNWPEYFYVFDGKGAVERWPVVRGPGIATTRYSEGLAYVPAAAADWPAELRGRFLMVGYNTTNGEFPRVDVIDGVNGTFTVTRQIPLPTDLPGSWGSVGILPDGHLLLSAYGDCQFYRADAWTFAALPPGVPMTLTAEPITDCTLWNGGEGLVVLPDSRVIAAFEPAQLLAFTAAAPGGPWTIESSVQLQYGLGMATMDGLAWDSARNRFLIKGDTTLLSPRGNGLFAVDESLSVMASVRTLSNVPESTLRDYLGLTYRADSDAVVTTQAGRAPMHFPPTAPPGWTVARTPALRLAAVGDESPLAWLDLTATLGVLSGWHLPLYNPGSWTNGPRSVTFLPDEDGYAVRLAGDSTNIYVLGADGTWDRTIPASVACADPTKTFRYANVAAIPLTAFGARFLVSGTCGRPSSVPPVDADVSVRLLAFLDGNGAEVLQVGLDDLPGTFAPVYVTAITSGKHAGDFALLDMHSQLVVFRVK